MNLLGSPKWHPRAPWWLAEPKWLFIPFQATTQTSRILHHMLTRKAQECASIPHLMQGIIKIGPWGIGHYLKRSLQSLNNILALRTGLFLRRSWWLRRSQRLHLLLIAQDFFLGEYSIRRSGVQVPLKELHFQLGKLFVLHHGNRVVYSVDVCRVRVHVKGVLDTANSNECEERWQIRPESSARLHRWSESGNSTQPKTRSPLGDPHRELLKDFSPLTLTNQTHKG